MDTEQPESAPFHGAARGFDNVMALAIEGSGTGLWDRDVAAGEIRYSPGWSAILGYQPDELSTRIEDAYARVHPDDLGHVQDAMQAHFQGRTEIYEVEHRLRCRDGSWKWVLSRGKVVERDSAGRALRMVGTTTDITATQNLAERLRKAEDDLHHQRQRLLQAQKMEAVGRLTGGIAHDFNNMLQGIGGGIEIARQRAFDGRIADVLRYLDLAQEAVNRAAALTRRLLAFARRQRLEPKPVDPSGLVANMAELVRRTVGPAIRLDLCLRSRRWVLCDVGELESALLNLVINARDAMPEGGQLTIDTEDILLPERVDSEHEGNAPGDYVAISVADTGTGMLPDVLEQAFEPFFTTKPVGHGTGLGLSQVYGFVRQSGGFVRMESKPRSGTTVRVCLPQQVQASIAEAAPPGPAPDAPGLDRTLLLVDDEEIVRMTLAERLRELGYRVLEAADGPAALQKLDTCVQIDMLITDVGLPKGMNGRQVAEAVRERCPAIPLLFITGYAGTDLPRGSEVIDKPFDLDTVARRVQSALARK